MQSGQSSVLPEPKLSPKQDGAQRGRPRAGCCDLASSMQEVAHLLRETLRVLCEELRVAERNNELLEAQCAHYVTELSRKRQIEDLRPATQIETTQIEDLRPTRQIEELRPTAQIQDLRPTRLIEDTDKSASHRVTWKRSTLDSAGTGGPAEGTGSFSPSGGGSSRHCSEEEGGGSSRHCSEEDSLASESSGSEIFEPNSPTEIEEALMLFHGGGRRRKKSTLNRRMTLKIPDGGRTPPNERISTAASSARHTRMTLKFQAEARPEVHERVTKSTLSSLRLSGSPGSTSSSDFIPRDPDAPLVC